MDNLKDTQRRINVERDVNVHLENKRKSRAFFWFMWIIYAVVMMVLYFASFVIQQRWVFAPRKKESN